MNEPEMARARPPRRLSATKKCTFAAVLVTSIFVSLFGILEFAVRLLENKHIVMEDGRFTQKPIGWKWIRVDGLKRHPPYSVFEVENEDGELVRVENDRLGLRNPKDLNLQPDRPTIIVLGDSFVQAINTPVERTMCRELERRLAHQAAQVVNAGLGGYSNAESLELLRMIHDEVAPDLVVLMVYLGNDLRDNYWQWSARKGAEKRSSVQAETSDLIFNITRWSRLVAAWETKQATRFDSLDEEGFDLISYFDFELLTLWNRPYPAVEVAREETRRILRELRDYCAERDLPLFIFAIPSKAQIEREFRLISFFSRSPTTKEKGLLVTRSSEGYSFDRPDEIYAEICDDLGLHYSSLMPIFRAHADEDIFYRIDSHWTFIGQSLAAEAIAATLRNRIPPSDRSPSHFGTPKPL